MILRPASKDTRLAAQATVNRIRYESDAALRERADQIHAQRMMPPPACDDCIRLALLLLWEEEAKDDERISYDEWEAKRDEKTKAALIALGRLKLPH